MTLLWQQFFTLLLAACLGMPILREILNFSKRSTTNALVGMWCLIWLALLIEFLALPFTSWMFPLNVFANSEWLGTLLLELVITVFLAILVLKEVLDENGSSQFWRSIWYWHERALLWLLPKKCHDEYLWHIRWRFLLWGRKVQRFWQYFSLIGFFKKQRWLWVSLSGVFAALLALYILTNGQWFTLPKADDLRALRDSSGSWTLITALISAPIAFVIWLFRDINNLWQIENQRKDINLKDFQKLAEWASGLHLVEDKVITTEKLVSGGASETITTCESTGLPSDVVLSTPSRREGSASLQVAAVVQLQAFLRGEFGHQFEKPAFTLLTSIWMALMQKHVDAWQDEFTRVLAVDHVASEEDMKRFEHWKTQLHDTAQKMPLAIAISNALAEGHGQALRHHPNALVGLLLTGMKCLLPGQQTSLELDGLNLTGIQWQLAQLSAAQLQKTTLIAAQLQGAVLHNAQLQVASLHKAQLQGADLSFAQLQGANLSYAKLCGASLEWSQLQGAHFLAAHLTNANLQQAQLQDADLTDCVLTDANLQMAQLQCAVLTRAKLNNTRLSKAKLQGADMFGASLKGAEVINSEFEGANLCNTKLQFTEFQNIVFDTATQFKQAITNDQTSIVISDEMGIHPLLTHAVRIKLRDQNDLRLPDFHYTEFEFHWNAANETQRYKAMQLAGTQTNYKHDSV